MLSGIKTRLRNILHTLDERRMSPAVRKIVRQEEKNGREVANRIRYVFFLLIGIATIAVTTSDASVLMNFALLGVYLLTTVAHTVVLMRSESRVAQELMQIAALIMDYGVFLFALIFYTEINSPDNYGFAIKNPIFYYFFMPLALSILQFRARPVLIGLFVIASIYIWLVIKILLSDVPHTQNWTEYTLGPAVIVSDLLTGRITVIIGMGLVFLYSIYRAIYMVQRIASVEAQKTSLARYFSPEVVDEITSAPEVLRKGGRQPVTVLFTDIRGFTAMSEGMDAEALADFLSEFRARMSAAIFENGGTLDKFIGDAIMATFGTPRPHPEPGQDARNALAAARGMLAALAEFNAVREARGEGAVKIGIGLHTGDVFAGNVGSEERLEFTVIGDAVNTASRIESLCKKVNATLLISEQVYEAAGRPADAEQLPRVRVKGKEDALQVYRIAKLEPERPDRWRRKSGAD